MKRSIYIYIDIVSAILVWGMFFAFRVNNHFFETAKPLSYQSFISSTFLLNTLYFVLFTLFVHYLSGIYLRRAHSRIEELFVTLVSSALITIVASFTVIIDANLVPYRIFHVATLYLFGVCFICTYLLRFLVTVIYYRRIKKGKVQNNIVIVGNGSYAHKVRESYKNRLRYYGTNVIGHVVPESDLQKNSTGSIVGTIENIDNVVKEYQIKHIIVARKLKDAVLFRLINYAILHKVELSIAPLDVEIIKGNVRITDVDSMPFVTITEPTMPPYQQAIKRVFDIVASAALLILTSPLFIYLAFRVKRDSKGPIFFKQERVGYYGKPFNLIKFRTMVSNAEDGVPLLSSLNDQRITPFGKTMRRYRLDEFPQLWNVLIGDMSMVGPRPERRFFIDQIIERAPYYPLLYRIRPGLIPWSATSVGYCDTIEKMIQRLNQDIIYINNMSLFLDLKIILYSVEVVIKGKGV